MNLLHDETKLKDDLEAWAENYIDTHFPHGLNEAPGMRLMVMEILLNAFHHGAGFGESRPDADQIATMGTILSNIIADAFKAGAAWCVNQFDNPEGSPLLGADGQPV